jgi:hypothetical protein
MLKFAYLGLNYITEVYIFLDLGPELKTSVSMIKQDLHHGEKVGIFVAFIRLIERWLGWLISFLIILKEKKELLLSLH